MGTHTEQLEPTTARPTTLAEIKDKAVIEVYSVDRPNLAGLIDKERASTYASVLRGDYPSIREGRRVRIPVPALLRLLETGEVDR